MKKLTLIFLIMVFLIFSLGIGTSIGKAPFAEVSSVKGEVTVIRAEESLEAVKGMDLLKGDTLKTGESSSVTVMFSKSLSSTLAESKEIALNELYMRTKLEALKKNIKKPESNITPAKINVDTIGGTRGTEEVEKKSKQLKNEHYWDEKVD
jgi:hypothetical protein